MKPYYDHAGITIYHGDCREILPLLGPVDLVLADPPYGISLSLGGGKPGSVARGNTVRFKGGIAGDTETFDPVPVCSIAKDYFIFGADHWDMLPSGGNMVAWDKGEYPKNDYCDCEFIWTTSKTKRNVFRIQWKGLACVKSEEQMGNLGQVFREHPYQKPIKLMKCAIELFPNAQIILDPFMGSGTTLVAAKQLNRRAIGIEIEERYCEIAARRLSQEVFDFGEPQR